MPKNDPCYEEAKRLQRLLFAYTLPQADKPPNAEAVAQQREKIRQALAARVTIHDHVVRVHDWAARKGWDEKLCEVPGTQRALQPNTDEPLGVDVPKVAMKIALIHSEISEALEELRKGEGHLAMRTEDGKPEGLVVELADAYIRMCQLCGALGLDLEGAVEAKLDYNDGRPVRHGGKAC